MLSYSVLMPIRSFAYSMGKLSIRKVISIITPRESNAVICCIQHKPVNFLLIFDLFKLVEVKQEIRRALLDKIFYPRYCDEPEKSPSHFALSNAHLVSRT